MNEHEPRPDPVAIELALILGRSWPPPGVPDTGAARALRDQIAADLAGLPPGVIPDIPG